MKIMVYILLLTALDANAYQLFRSGSSNDVKTHVSPYYCLAGGGSDEDWQEGWSEMLKNIHGGDILIIREDKKRGGYEEWLYEEMKSGSFPHFNSVTTLSLDGTIDSFDPKILEVIKKSELIFFAGGFQNNYFDYIKKTPLQDLIQKKINHKTLVLAGTSAGMAIMSDLAFGAHYKSPSSVDGFLSSKDILENPLRDEVDLIDGLFQLPYLKNFILDTHFARRNRQGRLMGFMAHGFFMENKIYNGIGVDEDTAFCFDLNGKGKFFGANHVYLAKPVRAPLLNNDLSLSWGQVHVKKFSSKDEIDLKSWEALYGEGIWNTEDFVIEGL